jgi:hypothetical protein
MIDHTRNRDYRYKGENRWWEQEQEEADQSLCPNHWKMAAILCFVAGIGIGAATSCKYARQWGYVAGQKSVRLDPVSNATPGNLPLLDMTGAMVESMKRMDELGSPATRPQQPHD